MRHLILFTLLIVQVIAFGFGELGGGIGFESSGHDALYFLGIFQDAVHNRLALILLTIAAALTLAARSIDFSLLALAALLMAVMTRFAPDNAVYYGAVPLAIVGGAVIVGVHGWLVGASLRRAVVVTLLALVGYRLVAVFAIADDGSTAFGMTTDYSERFGSPDLYWPLIFGTAFVVAIASFIARRAAVASQHPLDPEPKPDHEAFPRGWRIALFAIAGAIVGLTAVAQTATDLEASATWGLGDTASLIAALVIGGGFAANRPAPTLAVVLAALNLALLDHGLEGLALVHGESLSFDPTALFGPITLALTVACFVFDRAASQPESAPSEA